MDNNAYTCNMELSFEHAPEGFLSLIRHMEDNRQNMAVLKEDAIRIGKEYHNFFKQNALNICLYLLNSVPKAVFSMLTMDTFREILIKDEAGEVYACLKKYVHDNFSKHKTEKLGVFHLYHDNSVLGEDLKEFNRYALYRYEENPNGYINSIEFVGSGKNLIGSGKKIMTISYGKWVCIKDKKTGKEIPHKMFQIFNEADVVIECNCCDRHKYDVDDNYSKGTILYIEL